MATDRNQPNLRMALSALAIFCLALAIRLVYLTQADWGQELISAPISDASLYLQKAWVKAFVNSSGGNLAPYIPVSPYVDLLAAAYRLFGPEVAVPYVLNAVLGAAVAATLALTAAAIYGGAAGWIAGLLYALCGVAVYFGGLTVKSNAVVWLAAMGMLAYALWLRDRHWPWWLAASALLGMAALDRNNFIVVPLTLLALNVRREDGRRRAVLLLGLAGLLAGQVYTRWQHVGADVQWFSPLGFNFYAGNNPKAYGTYASVDDMRDTIIGVTADARALAEARMQRPLGPVGVNLYWLMKGLSWYGDQPVAALGLLARKHALMLAQETYGLPEQFRVDKVASPFWRWLPVDFAWLLAGVALFAFRRRRDEDDRGNVFAFDVLWAGGAYLVSVAAFFVAERFRMPLYVLLAPVAAQGMAEWCRAALAGTPERVRYAAIALAVYLASVALTGLHRDVPGWTGDLAERRAYESSVRQFRRETERLQTQAVRRPSARTWSALAEQASTYGNPDAALFAGKAIDAEPREVVGYATLKLVEQRLQLSPTYPARVRAALAAHPPEDVRRALEALL